MGKKALLIFLFMFLGTLSTLNSSADEGMWFLGSINQLSIDSLKNLGFELNPEKIYAAKKVEFRMLLLKSMDHPVLLYHPSG